MSNTDNLLDETVQSVEFNNKIKTIQEKLPSILDDFKKYYVFFNKNPTYSEYQKIYEDLKGNLSSIGNELLTITSDVLVERFISGFDIDICQIALGYTYVKF